MSDRPRPRWPTTVLPAVVGLAALCSVVPLPIWLVGTDPDGFLGAWSVWGWGGVVTAGIAAVLVILSRGAAVDALGRWWKHVVVTAPSRTFLPVVIVAFVGLSLLFTLFVFSGNPRNVDGFAQLFQARMFLAGRAWVAPPPEIGNFATLHMIVGPDRWFAQYPPGQSAVLAAGLAGGVWWLLNPLFGALLVVATYRVGRWACGESAGRLAALLTCVSPFALAVAGTEMNHLPAAALGVGAAACATSLNRDRWWPAALTAGAALGLMTAFRPLDAVAAAVPVGVIVFMTAAQRSKALLAIAIAGTVATIPTLWFNGATTGNWLEFGYSYLWGPNHSLGFHEVPWGIPLTFPRAIGLTALDLHQLNLYLVDFPFPIMLLTAAGYAVARRRLAERDVVPLVGVGALVGLLFFYWHRDVFYGPRFLYSVVPWLLVIVSRAAHLLVSPDRGRLWTGNALPIAVVTGAVVGLVMMSPSRIEAYRASTPALDLHPQRDARRAGIAHAVIVIPDGWGSRLIARMWAAGVPARRSTRLYAAIDACTLELVLDAAARTGVRDARLVAILDSLAALGQPGSPPGITDDNNLRLPAGAALPPLCVDELRTDQSGYLAFAPYLYLNTAHLDGEIIWARDLGRGNAALFERYRDRALYRYAPIEPGGAPRFTVIPRSGL